MSGPGQVTHYSISSAGTGTGTGIGAGTGTVTGAGAGAGAGMTPYGGQQQVMYAYQPGALHGAAPHGPDLAAAAEATRQRAIAIAEYLAAQGATVPVGPGEPIQTGPQAAGPPGANLFIFHIPNDCMNVHLYELFRPYGHLLSARIMVDKQTGRGRGFGFVSYAAAYQAVTAIEALDGFQIGHKRLAVSVKRSKEQVARIGPAAGAAAGHGHGHGRMTLGNVGMGMGMGSASYGGQMAIYPPGQAQQGHGLGQWQGQGQGQGLAFDGTTAT